MHKRGRRYGDGVSAGPQRAIRQLVVEALYESETSRHEASAVLDRRLHETADEEPALAEPKLQRRAQRMLAGVIECRDEADTYIGEAATQYPVETLAVVDRNILRLAIWELLSDNSAPVAAVVNEAVELAHRYGGESSPGFVNGVLRTVSQRIKASRVATQAPPESQPQT
ncbi:MAG: transcription antitermination factor NusB [Anaerolinea sp.]|nr:transcription antitermination factor NusB [Anaerolinea sp.]